VPRVWMRRDLLPWVRLVHPAGANSRSVSIISRKEFLYSIPVFKCPPLLILLMDGTSSFLDQSITTVLFASNRTSSVDNDDDNKRDGHDKHSDPDLLVIVSYTKVYCTNQPLGVWNWPAWVRFCYAHMPIVAEEPMV